MRQTRKPQLALGEARIEDIKLDHKSRDDIPAVLLGLQHLYSHEETREKLFSLLEEYILPGTNRNVGRPGMELWRILVMGVLKQGLGCDFDRLHELVNQHRTVREFLGHGAFSQDDTYEFQTIIDNVYLLTPELLSKIGQLVVESGHAVARKKPGEPLRGRCDSFVVETDVHYPTDVNLLWDAMRCLLRELGQCGEEAPPRGLAPVATSHARGEEVFQQGPLDATREEPAGPSRSLSRTLLALGRSSRGRVARSWSTQVWRNPPPFRL